MISLKGSGTADRRIAPRQQVTYRLDALSSDGKAGYLLDISSTGMRVRFKAGIDVGATQCLTLMFPRWLELGEGLELAGRFVWVRQTASGATEGGFAFDGLSRKASGVLSVLVQRLAEAVAEDRAEESP